VSNDYVISGGRSGFERLRVLSRVWGDTTESLLRSVGVGPGMRCLDVGCGAGDVSLFLASLVGPSGAVVGIDSDGVQLDLVRAECHRLGVTNVELVLQDMMQLEMDDAYDVVYSRFVLEHLSDPLEAVRRMWRAVRPGGLLIAEDGDFLADFCEPLHRASTSGSTPTRRPCVATGATRSAAAGCTPVSGRWASLTRGSTSSSTSI
jgi:ubiquinone/menaquinone biosynthesis C-methylase UbiE